MKFRPLALLAVLASTGFAAQQHIDFGSGAANDGDTAPVAFHKIEDNFTELYASADALLADISSLTSLVATKQDADADLSTIAGLSPSNDDVLQRKAGGWTNRSLAQLKADLSLSAADFGLGNVENTALSTWAGSTNLTTLGTVATGTWSATAISQAKGGTGGTDAATARSALGLEIGTDVQAFDSDLTSWASKTAPVGTVVGTSDSQTLTNKSISGGQITSAVATATALAANGTNCSAGNYPLGVDASGNAESCTSAAAGTGDASTNTATSVDSEVALFSGTGGKTLKRATGTGLAKLTSGVLSTATEGTDYSAPGGTDVAVADGGTGASTAAAARTNLGVAIGSDVQAWDADLDTWAGKTAPAGAVVGTSDSQTLTNKSISGGQITSAVATATALAANGTNCTAGDAAIGVDASGNAEGCFTPTSGAPTNATYITQTANGSLSDEQALSALSSGYMKVTTTTGVVSSVASILDTDLSANIPLINAGTNAFSGNITAAAITGSGTVAGPTLQATNANPRVILTETDQGSDLKSWMFNPVAGVLTLSTVTDAFGAGKAILAATRGPTTALSNISLGNATDNPTGSWLGSGTFTFGGALLTGSIAASSGSGNISSQATTPRLYMYETDQGSDLKRWDWSVASAVAKFSTLTDAAGAGKDALSITRGTTTAIADISIGNATDNPTINFLGTGNATFSGTPVSTNYFLSHTNPILRWVDTDQGTDLKRWAMDTDGGLWNVRTLTDANGTGKNAISVTRGTTTAISNVSFGNASDNPTYTFLGSGTITTNGGIVVNGNVAVGSNAISSTSSITGGRFVSAGTKFTATGCSNSTTVGGASAGKFTSGTTGTCSVAITLPTATNGWTCYASDLTTPVVFTQTASSTTSCTISATTVTGDVVTFMAMGY